MRIPTIIGVLLVAAGAYLFFRGGVVKTDEEVLKVGDLKVTAQESHPVEPWIAGAAVIGGVLLVATGSRRKA